MCSKSVLVFAAGLGLTLWLTSPVGAESKDVKLVRIPVGGYDFAVNPQSGGLAVLLPDSDEVVLYPTKIAEGTSGEVRAKVGRLPVGIGYKELPGRSLFAVVSLEAGEMTLLDAATLKQIKLISLSLESPSSVTTSANPQDPYVYYCAGRGHGSRLGRVNAVTGADEGAVDTGSESVMDAVVSADGSLVYLRGPWSPSGFQVYEILRPDPQRPRPAARQLRREHQSCPGYLPDAYGQFVVSGHQVYTPDLGKQLARLAIAPMLCSTVRPVLVGIEDDLVVAASANTFKVVGSTKLPIKPPAPATVKALPVGNPNADFKRFAYQTRVLEAPTSDCVLVCTGRSVCIVPYAALDLPPEPLLAVQVEGTREGAVGQQLALRLTPRDPVVKIEMTSGPRGAEVKDNRLTWTPDESQVGSHRVVLRISGKATERNQELTLKAYRPGLQVPFILAHFQVSPDGSAAVALGQDPVANAFPNQENRVRLALIDLQTSTITAERRMPVAVQTAAVDRHHVYAGLSGSDAFYALGRKDLADGRRLFTNGRVRELVPVNDELLFVGTQAGDLMVLTVPGLEPAEPGQVGIGIHLSVRGKSLSKAPPRRLGDGWWYDGCFYDAAFKKPRVVIRPSGFWAMGPGGQAAFPVTEPPQYMQWQNSYPAWLSPWGVTVANNQIVHGKQQVGSLQMDSSPFPGTMTTTILLDQPAVAALRRGQQGGYGPEARIRVELAFFDLVTGTSPVKMTLLDQPPEPGTGGFPFNEVTQLETAANQLIGISGNRLYLVKPPKLDPDKYPTPMFCIADQPLKVLGADDLSLPLPKLVGAKAPVEFALRQEMPGVDIDATAGKLKLRSRLLMQKVAEAVTPMAGGGWGPTRQPAEAALKTYLQEQVPRFERLMGRKPTGVPVWLSLGLVARDRSLQSLDIDYGLFVDVPTEIVQTRVMAAAAAAAVRTMTTPQWTTPSRVPDFTERRLQAMEQRLDQMNRKIDLIMELLQERKKKEEPKK
jgi:hypothetical protein